MAIPEKRTIPPRMFILGGTIAAITLVAAVIAGIASRNGVNVLASSGTPIPSATCPAPDTHPAWSKTADVTIHEAQANSVIVVHVGQTIEVALDATYKWKTGMPTPDTLVPQSPSGYFDSAHNLCIWRFTVGQTGDVHLPFERRLNCIKGQLCSDLIVYFTFAIQATA